MTSFKAYETRTKYGSGGTHCANLSTHTKVLSCIHQTLSLARTYHTYLYITVTVKRWYQVMVAVSVIITIMALIFWLALIFPVTVSTCNACTCVVYIYLVIHHDMYIHTYVPV